jgi:hypothetical protein
VRELLFYCEWKPAQGASRNAMIRRGVDPLAYAFPTKFMGTRLQDANFVRWSVLETKRAREGSTLGTVCVLRRMVLWSSTWLSASVGRRMGRRLPFLKS